MNADHIGQLTQKSRAERVNAEVSFETLLAIIAVLYADRRVLVSMLKDMRDCLVSTDGKLREFADNVKTSLVVQGPSYYGSETTMTWGALQAVLTDVVFGSTPWASTPIPSTLTTQITQLETAISQYESQAGIIAQDAQKRVEDKLVLVKKSLLSKPWVKTTDKVPTPAKPAQAAKPTPSVSSEEPSPFN